MLRNLVSNVRISFRRWLRNRTRPMTIEEAEDKKLFWSKVYMVGSIIIFSIVVKGMGNGSSEKLCSSIQVSKRIVDRMSDDSEVRIIKFTGLKKTTDVVMNKQQLLELAAEENASLAKQDNSEMLSE